jgi:hypothetical protein
MKSRSLRRARHVTERGDKNSTHRIYVGNLLDNNHMEHLEGDERITLRWIIGRATAQAVSRWIFTAEV